MNEGTVQPIVLEGFAFGSEQVRIGPVTELAHLDQCVEIQLAVWGYADGDLIPRRVFIVALAIGGQVIGAFAGEVLVGFAMSLPGYRAGRSYLHSHMLAVLPQYRNRGLGRRMKLAQREDALARGFDLMEWTFDPLDIKNAYLNIERLGAIARRYIPDFYGPSTSSLQGGLPTDRLVAEWWLRSDRVREKLGELARVNGSESAHKLVQVQVSGQVSDWKQNADQRTLALTLQRRNRLALESAFTEGLAVTGYRRSLEGDGCFLLGHATGLETTG